MKSVFHVKDPISVIDVPDDCTPEVQGCADLMTKWLNKLTVNSDPNNVSQTHGITKPCLICKKAGHTFADCSILNNHEFLKTAFIETYLFFSTVHWAQELVQMGLAPG